MRRAVAPLWARLALVAVALCGAAGVRVILGEGKIRLMSSMAGENPACRQ